MLDVTVRSDEEMGAGLASGIARAWACGLARGLGGNQSGYKFIWLHASARAPLVSSVVKWDGTEPRLHKTRRKGNTEKTPRVLPASLEATNSGFGSPSGASAKYVSTCDSAESGTEYRGVSLRSWSWRNEGPGTLFWQVDGA